MPLSSCVSTHSGKLVENRLKGFYPSQFVFETSQNITISQKIIILKNKIILIKPKFYAALQETVS